MLRLHISWSAAARSKDSSDAGLTVGLVLRSGLHADSPLRRKQVLCDVRLLTEEGVSAAASVRANLFGGELRDIMHYSSCRRKASRFVSMVPRH